MVRTFDFSSCRYPKGGVPAHLTGLLDFEPESGNFFPTVFINDFWLLKDYLKPINDTTTTLELDFFLAPLSAWWWNLYVQMDQSFKMQASMGSMGDGEADEIKVSLGFVIFIMMFCAPVVIYFSASTTEFSTCQ